MKISDFISILKEFKIDIGDVYIENITLYGINYISIENDKIVIKYRNLNS